MELVLFGLTFVVVFLIVFGYGMQWAHKDRIDVTHIGSTGREWADRIRATYRGGP